MRLPAYDPPQGNAGYQVHSWVELQLERGAILRDRDGKRIRHPKPVGYRDDGSPIWPMSGGSFITGTSEEVIYASLVAGAAKNTFTTEVAINDGATMGPIAHIPVDFWAFNNNGLGRGIRITARGIVASTVTPSYTFTVRLGATGSTSSVIALGSAALATSSTLVTTGWQLTGEFFLKTITVAGATSTGTGVGNLICGGFTTATAPCYPLYGAAASPGTATTVDTSIANFVNFNITCTASSSSNTITLQSLLVEGLN